MAEDARRKASLAASFRNQSTSSCVNQNKKTIIIAMENICETRPVLAVTFDSEAREKGERENPCESLYATSDRNGDFF
jgi:hypothetical protein